MRRTRPRIALGFKLTYTDTNPKSFFVCLCVCVRLHVPAFGQAAGSTLACPIDLFGGYGAIVFRFSMAQDKGPVHGASKLIPKPGPCLSSCSSTRMKKQWGKLLSYSYQKQTLASVEDADTYLVAKKKKPSPRFV